MVKHLRIISLFALCAVTSFGQFGRGFFPSGVISGNGLSTDLLAAYRFEETTGNPQDSSGNGHHLTENGTVGTATGIQGNSRTHDSTSDTEYFSAVSAAWNTFADGDFTIAYWFKPDASGGSVMDQVHVAKADNNSAVSWLIEIDNGVSYAFDNAMVLYASTDGSLPGAPLVTVEFDALISGSQTWYCVIMTRSGDDFSLYLGEEGEATFFGSDTVTQSGALFDNSTTPLTVGTFLSTGSPVATHDAQGEIDELCFWSRALSECERDAFFNAGTGRNFTSFNTGTCL